jgi:hypothetical protein
MGERYSDASMIRRRQLLEDALAETLRAIGDITHDKELGRCIAVSDDFDPAVRHLVSLWSLAEQIEVRLP